MANQAEIADWTIMMYIAADSGLANFAIESLRQLKSTAGKDVVVAAQVDLDGLLHTQKIKRYIFDGSGTEGGSIHNDRVGVLHDNKKNKIQMAKPKTLTDFIKWAFDHPQCKSKRHCLIIWGHGPDLPEEAEAALQVSGAASPKDEKTSLYLSPVDLGIALRDAGFGPKKKLDILGIDACSMGMIEVACQVSGCVDYMVASQEEVPDASFPYDKMLRRFRKSKGNVAEICRQGPKAYKATYRDYVFTKRTAVRPVTLSSVRPENTDTITKPLHDLAMALLASARNPDLGQAIIDARKESKGFVGGIYVDLFDFCRNLGAKANSGNFGVGVPSACKRVCQAIEARGDNACIVENQALDAEHCHGLSVYFPYLTNAEKSEIAVTPVRGILDHPVKGVQDSPIKMGPDFLDKIRKEGIERTEKYYSDLEFSRKTGWGKFIAHGWSRILAELHPDELDLRYSGEQCARNLLDLCKEGKQRHAKPKGKEPKGKAA